MPSLELTKAAGDFISRIAGPPAEQLGGLLADQIAFWRAKNLNRLPEKWYEEIENRRISPQQLRALPFGDAFRALEAASIEEDDVVQELWAKLLANAVDLHESVRIKKSYIDILKSLGLQEAAFLNVLWESQNPNPKNDGLRISFWQRYSDYDKAAAIQNLIRLQCIAYVPEAMPDPKQILKEREPVSKEELRSLFHSLGEILRRNADVGYGASKDAKIIEKDYALTNLGRDLMKACSNPRKHSGKS